jgi:hypothetical protein
LWTLGLQKYRSVVKMQTIINRDKLFWTDIAKKIM